MAIRWTTGFAVFLLLSGCGDDDLKSARVRATWTLDLETGEQGTPQADLHWGMQGRDLPYLAVRDGALIAPVDRSRWAELNAAELAKLSYAINEFSAWGPDAPVRKGSVFGVRTREGNIAKVRVKDIRRNHALDVEWVLFNTAPPKPKPAPGATGPKPVKPAPVWETAREEALAAYREHRPEDAFAACSRAIEAAEQASYSQHALALVTCGGLLELHRRYPEKIEDWLKQGRAIAARLEQRTIVAELGPREALLKERAYRMLGLFYRDRNRNVEAAENFANAVDSVRALPPPETAEHRLALRSDLYELGTALGKLGLRGTAKRALGEAREYYLKSEPNHPTLKSIDAQLKRLEGEGK